MSDPPDFEFNPRHPMIVKLDGLRQKNGDLAAQIAEQVLDNARMAAGMLDCVENGVRVWCYLVLTSAEAQGLEEVGIPDTAGGGHIGR